MCAESKSLYIFGGASLATTQPVTIPTTENHHGFKTVASRVKTMMHRSAFADVWIYDVQERQWRTVSDEAGVCPRPRRGHTATVLIGKTKFFPTRKKKDDDSDDLLLDDSYGEKTQHKRTKPSSLDEYMGDPDDEEDVTKEEEEKERTERAMVVIGGTGPDARGVEVQRSLGGGGVWAFDLETTNWHPVQTSGCTDAALRFDHTATLVNTKIIVIGGVGDDGRILSDVASFDVETACWTRLSLEGPRLTVHGHGACPNPANPSEIFVLGGFATWTAECTNLYESEERHHSVDLKGASIFAVDTSQPRNWRIVPSTRGQRPVGSYGGCVASWCAARDLSVTELARERGPELEKLGLRVAPRRKSLTRDGEDRRLPCVPASNIVNQEAVVLVFGGSRISSARDLFVPNDLFLYDCNWSNDEATAEEVPSEAPTLLTMVFDKIIPGGASPCSKAETTASPLTSEPTTTLLGPRALLSGCVCVESSSTPNFDKNKFIDVGHLYSELHKRGGVMPDDITTMKTVLRGGRKSKRSSRTELRSSKTDLRPLTTVRTTLRAAVAVQQLRHGLRASASDPILRRPQTAPPGSFPVSHASLVEHGRTALHGLPRGTTAAEGRRLFHRSLATSVHIIPPQTRAALRTADAVRGPPRFCF